jgi:hypothetical protein
MGKAAGVGKRVIKIAILFCILSQLFNRSRTRDDAGEPALWFFYANVAANAKWSAAHASLNIHYATRKGTLGESIGIARTERP